MIATASGGVDVGITVEVGVGVISSGGVDVGSSVEVGVGVISSGGVDVGSSVEVGADVVSSGGVGAVPSFLPQATNIDDIKIMTRDSNISLYQKLLLPHTILLPSLNYATCSHFTKYSTFPLFVD